MRRYSTHVNTIVSFTWIVLIGLLGCSSSLPPSQTPSETNRRALLIIDVQNDFCPGGALPVKEGDKVVPIINSLQDKFELVVATQDWHPANHSSFVSKNPDGLWPDHCVQDTYGAELVAGLNKEKIARIFKKGTDVAIDSYSGFFDNEHRKSTGLADYLRSQGVSEVYIVGLATDYCVKFTALDAKELGFNATVVLDATRGVEVNEGDVAKAIDEMKKAGVNIAKSDII